MLTAMQRMLDDLLAKRNVYENAKMYECVATLETSIGIAQFLLEKEKEQIMDSFDYGYHCASNGTTAEITLDGKMHYNQTYNKKQHIIDIMEADENDGLYNQSFQKSDKEIENWHIIESLKEGRTYL